MTQTTLPNKFIIRCAVIAFISMTGSWTLMAAAQWPTHYVALSLLPLLIMLAFMLTAKPAIYFYAALLAMPYIATTITQIIIASDTRFYATLCLACGLAYLALLKFTLRALHGN